MIRLVVALAVGLVVSFALNRLVRPRAATARAFVAHVIQGSLYLLLAALLALLLRRPAFACALVLCGQLAMVLVHAAKFRALREPLLFTDLFEMSGHVLRHPRFYLPFLGAGKAFAAMLSGAGALYLGIALESAVVGAAYFAVAASTALGAGAVLGVATVHASGRISMSKGTDFDRLGLVASCWVHWMTEVWSRPRQPERWPLGAATVALTNRRFAPSQPHVVVVQSESFFDARRLHPDVRSDVLAVYDSIVARAVCHGRLSVSSWGANTVRSEFAFLTGVATEALGLDGFNPYRRVARLAPPTIASALRAAGYRTVCVHPFPGDFYDRRRVLPALGFERFIDIRGFEGAERCGPFVSDAAVARLVNNLLAESADPLFLFVITMENHGPLHLERPLPGTTERLLRRAPERGLEELAVYLGHLHNADRMLGALTEVPAGGRERTLCFFGDHVPTMPGVYARLGFDDPRTDYLIWSSRWAAGVRRQDLGIEALALELLEATGTHGSG